MFSLVLCLIIFIIKTEASDQDYRNNPTVNIDYQNNVNETFTVYKNAPFQIVIKNGYARYVWCNNYYREKGPGVYFQKIIRPTLFNAEKDNYIKITNVTPEMSTRWTCTILQSYNGLSLYEYLGKTYTAKDLRFNIHVRGAKTVRLNINNLNLAIVLKSLSSEYDGEAHYYYKDNEDIDFYCTREPNTDTLRSEYYNAEGDLLFKTDPQKEETHRIRTVLKTENKNYYIDCICGTNTSNMEYRYRTFLKLSNSDFDTDPGQHVMTLRVNGIQQLPLRIHQIKHNVSYQDDYMPYKYIDGEVLNITCQKIYEYVQGNLVFYFMNTTDILSNVTVLRTPSMGKIMISIDTSKNVHKKILACQINNTDVQKLYVILPLLSDIPENEVRILGLPRENVLYQYTNDLRWTIEYQYTVSEIMHLTCVAKGLLAGSKMQWKYRGRTILSETSFMKSLTVRSTTTFSINLDASHNKTKIKCIYIPKKGINKTVEVILRLKSDLASEGENGEITSGNDEKRPLIILAVCVGVVIVVIAMICLLFWRKRTKQVNLIQSYDNLSNQNESPIPAFPSQWEIDFDDPHYAKIDEGVMQENYNYCSGIDKMYKMPHNRQSNTPSENHYTEIDDYFKPKNNGLATSWNTARPAIDNKGKALPDLKSIPSKMSQGSNSSNFSDANFTYDNLRQSNLPFNIDKQNGNKPNNYGSVPKTGKHKSVTFRQINNDVRPAQKNYSEGNYRNDRNINKHKIKHRSDGHYANTDQGIYMQPGNLKNKQKRDNNHYENHFVQNESDTLEYAEPYGDLGIQLKNDWYR